MKLNFQTPPSSTLKLSVIIPAKDEADYIEKALEALLEQVDDLGNPVLQECYEVLVFANNCNDDTFEICQTYQRNNPSFQLQVEKMSIPKDIAHIGTARRLLMDAAYDRLMSVAGEKGIIASTDADSEVDSKWVYHILTEISNGAEVVGGRILAEDAPKLCKEHHLRDVTYRLLKARLESELDPCPIDPWPRHYQCFGASLAVTCYIYELGGRLPIVPYLEDEAFRKALTLIDAKIRHSMNVIVHTSSRLFGKVEVGFSGQLKEWEMMSIHQHQQLEESFEAVRFKAITKNLLRKIWFAKAAGQQFKDLEEAMSDQIGICLEELDLIFTESQYFGNVWEKILPRLKLAQKHMLLMQPVEDAIHSFEAYFADRSEIVQPTFKKIC